MATGTVKWFNPQKGFGFIEPSDGGKDVFVHISAVERAGLSSLKEGQRVKYEIARDRGEDSSCQPGAGRVTGTSHALELRNSDTPNFGGNVRYWHLADIEAGSEDVRVEGESGRV